MSLSRTSQKSTDNKLVKTLVDDFPATLEPAERKKSAKSFFSSFFSQGGDNEQVKENNDKMAYSLNALDNMGKSSPSRAKPKSSSIFSALSFVPEDKVASVSANSNTIISKTASSSSGSNVAIIPSFISTIQNLSWITWFVIIIVLAFLGFNIFMYLAQTTQLFSNILAGILGLINKLFGNAAVETVQQTTNASATGAQGIVDFTASAATSGINAIQHSVQNTPSSSSSSSSSYTGSTSVPGITSGKPAGQSVSTTISKLDNVQETTLNTALNNATQTVDTPQNQQNPIDDGPYQADDSYSSIQKPTSKAGWCFIGEQQNFRSCVEVGDNDICMSGNIFPTQDICVNPSLRQ